MLPFIVWSVGVLFFEGVKWQKPDLAGRPGKVIGPDFIDKIHGPLACMVLQRHSMGIQAPGTCPMAYVRNDTFDGEQWILISKMKVLTKTFCSGKASTAIGFRGAMLNCMES